MIDSKYYTPSLEEFCIGFEYEYTMDDYSRYLDVTLEDEWRKEVFYAGGNDVDGLEVDNISNLLENNQIRVKYLDAEDMLSLGFTQDKDYKCSFTGKSGNKFFRKDESAGFNNGVFFTITLGGGSMIQLEYAYYSSYSNPSGKIQMIVKNKLELSKLLNQFSN